MHLFFIKRLPQTLGVKIENIIKKAKTATGSGKRKFGAAILVLTGIFLCLAGFLFWYGGDRRTFARISDELFSDELAGNTLNMHYTVAHPENYDITYTPRLSVYSPGQPARQMAELDTLLNQLRQISPDRLSPADAYAYRLLRSGLENRQVGNRLYLYEEPFSPASGVQSTLPVLLADYVFRAERDVTDYLAILNQIDEFLAGFILFEQEKAAAGLFMSEAAVTKVIEQCDRIMDEQLLSAGTHFLQTTFQERLETLVESNVITATQKELYRKENNRLLLTVVRPAYEKTGDQLFLLKDSGQNKAGLFYFPEGREYYQYLLKNTTGSYRSIEEVKHLLYQDFKKNYDALLLLGAAHEKLPEELQRGGKALPISKPEEILTDLKEQIADQYPALPDTDEKAPRCEIKAVSRSMEPYSSPAYYLTPPIDSYDQNTIYINQKNNISGISLYTTLAHEGYPGHLYQTVYHRAYMEKTDGNLLRYILHYSGYLEGWALYVEMDSFRYAQQLMAEENPDCAYIYDYYRLNHSLQLCLYSLLDIAIHYDGADSRQVGKILAVIGIKEEAMADDIYAYIVEEPTNYLKYYLGYLEILALKEEAAVLWGEDYSDYEFHRFFLEAGPSDFGNLRVLLRGRKNAVSDTLS